MSRMRHQPPGQGSGKRFEGGVVAQPARRRELVEGQEDRRGQVRGGRLGEQADDVVAHRHVAVAAVPPHVVGDAGGDARQPLAGHVEQGPRARPRRCRSMIPGSRFGSSGIAEGRHEEALAGGALLVHVPVHLRVPDLVEELGGDARLVLGQHEPVAVVVVPGVELVELQEPRRLVGRVDGLPVPVRDMVQAVGVHAGRHQHHALLAGAAPGFLLAGRELVGEGHAELGPRALGGVHRDGDEEEELALPHGRLELLGGLATRIGQRGGVGPQLLEASQVLLARDSREQEGATFGGVPTGSVRTRGERSPRCRK